MGYPHDEFDDVPEDSERRGAYRGVEVDPTRSTAKTVAMALAGVLALIVGGFMFVFSPRLSTPEASSTLPLASATASASATEDGAGEEDSGPKATGTVYNGGAYQGAAGQTATVLGNNGYSVAQVANWQGTALYNSTVFYSEGHAEEAEEIAQLLGITYISQDPSVDYGFYVVLAADYAGLPAAGSEEAPIYDLSQTPENTEATEESETLEGTETLDNGEESTL